MKFFLTLIPTLLLTVLSLAQNSTLTIINPEGQLFYTSLNNVRQHSEAYTNVKITSLTTGTYEVKLTFQDGKTAELNKKILLEDVNDYVISISGKGKNRALKFATAKSAKKLIPADPPVIQYRPNDQIPFSDKKMGDAGGPVIEVGTVIVSPVGEFTKSYDPSDTLSPSVHEQAYKYFHSSEWPELERMFTVSNINGGWPPNRGFVSYRTITLERGDKIDRYGGYTDATDGQFHDKGSFASPMGASFGSRALPASSQNKPYMQYVILKPIPNVKAGEAIPWFNQPGMGIQYELPENIDDLLKEGYIQKM